jgi:alpha/beta hydrolase fold
MTGQSPITSSSEVNSSVCVCDNQTTNGILCCHRLPNITLIMIRSYSCKAKAGILAVFLLVAVTAGFQRTPHQFLRLKLPNNSKYSVLLPLGADDVLTADVNPTDARKIEIKRYHETWRWTHKGRTYNINYRVEGNKDATPILLTHGFGANLNHFRYNIAPLVDAGFRVYAMDLLGFGGSEKPTNATTVGFSVDLFSQQIVDFIRGRIAEEGNKSNLQSWVLAGNSIGGRLGAVEMRSEIIGIRSKHLQLASSREKDFVVYK